MLFDKLKSTVNETGTVLSQVLAAAAKVDDVQRIG